MKILPVVIGFRQADMPYLTEEISQIVLSGATKKLCV